MGHFRPAKGSPESRALALILLVQSRHQKAPASRSADVGIREPGRPRGERPSRLAGLARRRGLAWAAAWLPAARLCLPGKLLLPSGCRQRRGLGIAASSQGCWQGWGSSAGSSGTGCFSTRAQNKPASGSADMLGRAVAPTAELAAVGCSALRGFGGGCCSACPPHSHF